MAQSAQEIADQQDHKPPQIIRLETIDGRAYAPLRPPYDMQQDGKDSTSFIGPAEQEMVSVARIAEELSDDGEVLGYEVFVVTLRTTWKEAETKGYHHNAARPGYVIKIPLERVIRAVEKLDYPEWLEAIQESWTRELEALEGVEEPAEPEAANGAQQAAAPPAPTS